MREGTLNESNVLSRRGEFLGRESYFTLTSITEYGLLCAKGLFYAAFSPDAIVVVEDKIQREVPVPFLVEIKSKCMPTTVQKEMAIATRHGTFRTVFVSLTDGEKEFKQLVPEPEYRCQLVHGIACAGLHHAFYVVASLHKITSNCPCLHEY